MSSLDTAVGLVGGFRGALKDAQNTRQQKEDRQFELQQRADTARRASKAEERGDMDWGLSHAVTQEQLDQHRRTLANQGQQEGLHTMIDAVNANVDPAMIEQQMNSVGKWRIKPGTLQYDQSPGPDRQITFTGEGGNTFSGTVGQLQALFGQQTGKKDLMNVPQGGAVYDPNTNKSVFNNPKEDTKQGKSYLTAGKNQRIYQLDDNGQVVRDAQGNPKMIIDAVPGAGDDEDGTSGRKLSPYNPESHAEQASKAIDDAYKTHYNAELKSLTFDTPDDSERAVFGKDLVTSFLAKKNAEGQNYGAGELANAAFKASKIRLTANEAQAQVKRTGIKPGTPQYDQQVAKLLRDSDVKAAQVWNEEIDKVESKHQGSAAGKAKKTGEGGKPKRSLDDIFGNK